MPPPDRATLAGTTSATPPVPGCMHMQHVRASPCRPQRLHRLGETHRSHCHPERETALALSETTPTSCWYQLTHSLLVPVAGLPHPSHGSALSGDPARLWHSFTRTLALALRPQNINPYLTVEEEEERQACRSVASFVKYFVPERSLIMWGHLQTRHLTRMHPVCSCRYIQLALHTCQVYRVSRDYPGFQRLLPVSRN